MEPEYEAMIVNPNLEDPLNSVSIWTRSKAPPAISVKMYHRDVEVAAKEVSRLFDQLTLQYDEWYKHRNPPESDDKE